VRAARAVSFAYPLVGLRPATAADCDRVWTWSFAPDVRAVSGSPGEVSLEDHRRWYALRLGAAGEPMWIVEAAGEPAGVVRIDRGPAAGGGRPAGRISIALDPRARGRGLGRRAIAAACRAFGAPVIAEIFATNTASRLAFEAAGFVQVGGPPSAGTATGLAAAGLLTYAWRP
jgi:L-amino acid N-acyltransferase YncA